MAIIIHRLSEKPQNGKDKYCVRVNKELITTFSHQRSRQGLAQCLRDAADAVDAQRLDDQVELFLHLDQMNAKW